MDLILHKINDAIVAELPDNYPLINNVEDILDLMVNAGYMGARKSIIRKEQLPSGFFDLKTGVAGEILQKFSNYRMHLAIAGDFSQFTSKSLKDFIFESNRTGQILFVASVEEAKQLLSDHK